MQFISLGGWCGTRLALDQEKITDKEPHNLFDHLRSSSKGVLECIKSDFSLSTILPEPLVIDTRFRHFKPFVGEHFGFYHHDLKNKDVLASIDRKIARFISYCTTSNDNKKIVFIRTCVIPDYKEELADMIELQKVFVDKYPNLKFIIVFIIPDQNVTAYYRTVNDKLFVFTLNDKSYKNFNLGKEYRNIFNFILNNDLFSETFVSDFMHEEKQDEKVMIDLASISTRLCLVDDLPAVNYYSK